MAKKRVKVPKESQTFIEGTAPERIPAIEKAATKYVDARDARMELLESEVKLKSKLIEVMKENNQENYSFDGFMVELNHLDEDTVKVKKLRAASDE